MKLIQFGQGKYLLSFSKVEIYRYLMNFGEYFIILLW